jgi:hypothetical protein
MPIDNAIDDPIEDEDVDLMLEFYSNMPSLPNFSPDHARPLAYGRGILSSFSLLIPKSHLFISKHSVTCTLIRSIE